VWHTVASKLHLFSFEEKYSEQISKRVILQMHDVGNTVLHLRHWHDLNRLVVVFLFLEVGMLKLFPEILCSHKYYAPTSQLYNSVDALCI
jgi:hypothetical protein